MSRGYWIAAVAFVVAFSGYALADPPQHKHQQDESGEEQRRPRVGAIRPPSILTNVIAGDAELRPDYHSDSCYENENHENADLCAQWRSAIAAEKATELAMSSNLISGISAVLSFIGTLLVIAAIRLAYQANKISRDIGQAQVRAYVQVGDVESKFVTEGGNHFLRTHVYWQNTGVSPTRNLTWWLDFKVDNFSGRHDFVRGSNSASGSAVIGAGLKAPDIVIDIPTSALPADFHHGRKPISIFGEVRYGDVFNSDPRHLTEFTVELLRGAAVNKTHKITVDVFTPMSAVNSAT